MHQAAQRLKSQRKNFFLFFFFFFKSTNVANTVMIYVAEGALRKLISLEDKRDGLSSWLWNPFSTPLYFHELV